MAEFRVTLYFDEQMAHYKTRYTPGLSWNEHTEAVDEAVEKLVEAVQRCQAAPHDPHYDETEAARG